MASTIQNIITIGQATRKEMQQKQVTFLAGSIAYHVFISLLPVMLLAFLFFAAIGSEELQTQVVASARGLSPAIDSLIETTIETEQGRASASLIGVVTLMWGSLKLFRALDTAFSQIYGVEPDESIVDQLRDGLIALFAIGFAIVAMVIAGALLALFPALPFIELLNPLVLLVALIIAFFPMYYLFPGVETSPRAVLPGTIFAALGWTVLQGLFQIYVRVVGPSASGVLGAVLLLITWLYLSGLVLLIGVALNAILAKSAETQDEHGEPQHRSLTRDEAGQYLRMLREQLTGRYDRMHAAEIPTDEGFLNAITDRPATIELTEQTRESEGGQQYEVRIQWSDREYDQ